MNDLAQSVNTVYEHIAEFHHKIHHPNPITPQFFESEDGKGYLRRHDIGKVLDGISRIMKQDTDRFILRFGWIVEEVAEGLMSESPVGRVDALLDMLVFILGTFGEMGFKPGRSFEAVHKANMSKNVSVNGAKVTKPKGWVGPEPDIEKEIELQLLKAGGESLCPAE